MHQGKLDCRVRFVPTTCLQLFPVEARWRAIRRAQFKGTPASWFVVVVVVPEVDYPRTVWFRGQGGLIMCKMHIHERLSLKQVYNCFFIFLGLSLDLSNSYRILEM
nr:unnamed protein product [Callosobruchus chinensis]